MKKPELKVFTDTQIQDAVKDITNALREKLIEKINSVDDLAYSFASVIALERLKHEALINVLIHAPDERVRDTYAQLDFLVKREYTHFVDDIGGLTMATPEDVKRIKREHLGIHAVGEGAEQEGSDEQHDQNDIDERPEGTLLQ